MSRPIGIDLFAGAGGLSLGFEQAGFDIAAAVEIDPIHCAVHKFNFPKCAVIPRSVVGLSASEIRLAAGIGNRSVDCVFGGPPCQGFSMIGHRALEDPRNSLVLEFVRLVAELDARTFVFENVKGLTLGRHRAFLDELFDAFGAKGYDVRLPWSVLDAADYGVPQHRQRLLLMGARRGGVLPDYIPRWTRPADEPRLGDPIGPTCADALSDLPDVERYPALLESDELCPVVLGSPTKYSEELRCITAKAWHYGIRRDWPTSALTSSARTEHTDISRRRFAETAPGTVEPISRFYRLSPSGLCNTLRAGTDGARGAFTSPRPIHYAYPRCITVREMARLHGFPDWFRFHATKWHGARQVGNAVPPPLGRAVAGAIARAIGYKPVPSKLLLSLGDKRLLSWEMGEAAKYFNVDAPRTVRDRHSGAHKRKQVDIERERMTAKSRPKVISR